MRERFDNPAQQPIAQRKARDGAFILPVVGMVLLVLPIANIFQLDLYIGGVPFTALYLFVVWGALIACAAVLSRRLGETDDDLSEPSQEP